MQSGLWPIRPAPFVDELMTSWIARLAHGHGLRPASLIEIIRPTCADFAALDWTADTELLSLLAARVDIPRSTVESLVLRLDPDLHDLLHHNWQGPALQYCAECLAESVPYYRRSWRLACVRVCPHHHTILRDECRYCGSTMRLDGLQPSKSGLGLCPNCGHAFASPGDPLPSSGSFEKLIAVQERIARRLV